LLSIQIRPAIEDDQPAIHRLIRQAGINPLGLNWRRFTVAVELSGVVVGCGQLKQHRDGTVELASLAVVPRLRGEGLGRRLIEALIGRGPDELWLMCRSSLASLYRKFGFEEVEEPEAMPTYFRRVRGLAGLVHQLAHTNEHLAVMLRQSSQRAESS
jgi:N-acetylglutamate synthase-like GNAT family acetyltransferase